MKTLLIDIAVFRMRFILLYIQKQPQADIYGNYDITKNPLRKEKESIKSLYRETLTLLFDKFVLQTVEEIINNGH